jgi:hypothetical protein
MKDYLFRYRNLSEILCNITKIRFGDLVDSGMPVAAQSINHVWCPEYADSFVI